jgi:putative ATP-binding cassette transporter
MQRKNFLRQLADLADAVHHRPGRSWLYLLAAGLVFGILATVYFQVLLNAWNEPFYDAIRNRQFASFVEQLFVFFQIAAVLLILNVAQTGLIQAIRLKLREMATLDLVETWMTGKRASRITRAGVIGVNPDQRIHEDARHLTELTTDLGVGLLQSMLLLFSFIYVLWGLSRTLVFHFGENSFSIPGYMVWAALLYAASGSLLSWRVGRPLVGLNVSRYAQEAALRVALVRGSEQADAIALSAGERDERRLIESEFSEVLKTLRSILSATVKLTFVTAGYGWTALVFPIIIAAPAYFAGDLSFGELMMVVGAFNQVQQALRWFVDNTAAVADWQATIRRVTEFRQALEDLDRVEHGADQILRIEGPAERMIFEDLVVMNFNAAARLADRHVEVQPGDRILILGKPATCKSTLFMAIAGLWNWGTGCITVPPVSSTIFLSQRPFLPPRSLRSVLTYAGIGQEPAVSDLVAVLSRVGLDYLAGSLESTSRWDLELTNEEQQRLILARILVAKPRWVISDEALDPVSESVRDLLISIVERELKEAAVVNISPRADLRYMYSRLIRLEPLSKTDDPNGAGPRLTQKTPQVPVI